MTPKIYKFHRVDPEKNIDVWERVVEEVWKWEALYVDGTVLKQFDDETGLFHQFREIDQEKLATFRMVSRIFPEQYHLLFNPGRWKLVHYYKRVVLHMATPHEQKITLYVFGYENNVNGVVVKNLNVIDPHGNLIQTDDMNRISIT